MEAESETLILPRYGGNRKGTLLQSSRELQTCTSQMGQMLVFKDEATMTWLVGRVPSMVEGGPS